MSLLATRAKQNNKRLIDVANQKFNTINHFFTIFSVLGPIILSAIYLVFPIDFTVFVWWKAFIDLAATIILIVCLSFLLRELTIIQAVISKIETSKESREQTIQTLETQIEHLEKNQSFYVLAAQMLAEMIRDGKKDIESLAKTLLAVIHLNLSQITGHNNFTLNLYERNKQTVKMIMSTTRHRHIRRDSLDIPVLYNNKKGLDINDVNIRDYYCIKCMAGKIPGENGKYILHDWVEIANSFKWERWNNQKKAILKSRDRQKSKQLGFLYNQYLGFEIMRDDGILIFFEIIANDDVELADRNEIHSKAYFLCETYTPLLSILWDIST